MPVPAAKVIVPFAAEIFPLLWLIFPPAVSVTFPPVPADTLLDTEMFPAVAVKFAVPPVPTDTLLVTEISPVVAVRFAVVPLVATPTVDPAVVTTVPTVKPLAFVNEMFPPPVLLAAKFVPIVFASGRLIAFVATAERFDPEITPAVWLMFPEVAASAIVSPAPPVMPAPSDRFPAVAVSVTFPPLIVFVTFTVMPENV